MSNIEVMAAQETVRNSEELAIRFDTVSCEYFIQISNNVNEKHVYLIRALMLNMFFLSK